MSFCRSCNPDHSVHCSWDDYNSPDDNDSELIGALVGGPDEWDNYNDARDDYISNEVACDYNAGFQTGLAGKNSNNKTIKDLKKNIQKIVQISYLIRHAIIT